jgi:hypothetical protein
MIKQQVLAWFLVVLGVATASLSLAGRVLYGWHGATVTLNIVIGLGLFLIGLFLRDIAQRNAQDSGFSADNENTNRSQARSAFIERVEQLAVGVSSGITTAILFLVVYFNVDFDSANDVSEKFVHLLCTGIKQPDRSLVVWDYPPAASLLPEFIALGSVTGIVVALAMRPWEKYVCHPLGRFAILAPLSGRIGSCILFGLFWGFVLGGIFNTAFFGASDGRPFLSLKTASIAAVLSVLAYVTVLYAFRRKTYSDGMLSGLIALSRNSLKEAEVHDFAL